MLNFVPSEFTIPEKMETEEYRLRMLSIDDVEKDFEAANVSDNPLKGELSDAVAELFSFLLKENKNDGSLVQVLPGGYDEKTD